MENTKNSFTESIRLLNWGIIIVTLSNIRNFFKTITVLPLKNVQQLKKKLIHRPKAYHNVMEKTLFKKHNKNISFFFTFYIQYLKYRKRTDQDHMDRKVFMRTNS